MDDESLVGERKPMYDGKNQRELCGKTRTSREISSRITQTQTQTTAQRHDTVCTNNDAVGV